MFDGVGPLSSKVVRLHELAGEVAADLDGLGSGLDGPAAVECFAELVGATRQLDLARCLTVERIDRTGAFTDDGSRTTVAFVRRAANESDRWAALQVRIGRALADRMPHVRKAWLAGLVGMAQAEIIAAATGKLDDDLAAAMEHTLAEAAPAVTRKDLSNLAEAVRQQADPEQAARKTRSEYEKQGLWMSQTMHGRWQLNGYFDAEAGAIISQCIDAFTSRAALGRAADGGQVDPPPAAFRRAQALLDICRQAAGHHDHCDPSTGHARPTIIATAAITDLTAGYGAGDVEGGGILAIPVLRRLACDAQLIRRIDAGDGQLLDFGRKERIVPPSLRRYLISRDGGCLWPGCDVTPIRCDAHHQKEWIRGGQTNRHNCLLLCLFHHHLVHEDQWTLTGNPEIDGDLTFHPPPDDTKHQPVKAERKTLHHAMRTLLDAINTHEERGSPAPGERA